MFEEPVIIHHGGKHCVPRLGMRAVFMHFGFTLTTDLKHLRIMNEICMHYGLWIMNEMCVVIVDFELIE